MCPITATRSVSFSFDKLIVHLASFLRSIPSMFFAGFLRTASPFFDKFTSVIRPAGEHLAGYCSPYAIKLAKYVFHVDVSFPLRLLGRLLLAVLGLA